MSLERAISPKKLHTEAGEKSSKNLFSKKENSPKKSISSKIIAHPPKVKSGALPENINEYLHIIKTFQVMGKELEWVLHLRSYPKSESNFIPEKTIQNPPRFSSENDYKYTPKSNWDIDFKGKSTYHEHLMKHRIGGEANQSQLQHEMSLRRSEYENKDSEGKWSSSLPKNKDSQYIEFFLPPVTESNRQKLTKIEKFVSRPYLSNLSKIKYLGKDIVRKSVEKNNMKTLAMSGEHYNLNRYSDQYQSKNLGEVRHILASSANHSISRWSTALRSRNEKIVDYNLCEKNEVVEMIKVKKSDREKATKEVKEYLAKKNKKK